MATIEFLIISLPFMLILFLATQMRVRAKEKARLRFIENNLTRRHKK